MVAPPLPKMSLKTWNQPYLIIQKEHASMTRMERLIYPIFLPATFQRHLFPDQVVLLQKMILPCRYLQTMILVLTQLMFQEHGYGTSQEEPCTLEPL